ncbi:hypothetical protein L218DRAFT_580233 [Marasmius fiardii PR-910]|nr:hypothetical protein L218DRAFT_580233 [Marasmius fiardii PR-910]
MDPSLALLNGLDELVECLEHQRFSDGLAIASAVLFLYDYTLTFADEIDYVWWSRRLLSPTTVAFFFSRYSSLTAAIMTLIPYTRTVNGDRLVTILRMVAIIASEAIAAIRTWAIWSNSKRMFWFLSAIAIVRPFLSVAVVAEGVISSRDLTLVPLSGQLKSCTTILSQIGNVYIVPYSMAIVFECANLVLSLARILRWRKNIPSIGKTSMIDTLYRDGITYFSWMIVLSTVNIAIIVQSKVTQLRVGGVQLQAGFHSILATRMILHVARHTSSNLVSPRPHAIDREGLHISLTTEASTQFTSCFESEGLPSHDLHSSASDMLWKDSR